MNYVPALPHCCISCGCEIHDDGPEQAQAWLESMCPECHAAHVHSLRDDDDEPRTLEEVMTALRRDEQREADAIAEYDRRNADRTRDYEPKEAF